MELIIIMVFIILLLISNVSLWIELRKSIVREADSKTNMMITICQTRIDFQEHIRDEIAAKIKALSSSANSDEIIKEGTAKINKLNSEIAELYQALNRLKEVQVQLNQLNKKSYGKNI